jgi:hypothetical protein
MHRRVCAGGQFYALVMLVTVACTAAPAPAHISTLPAVQVSNVTKNTPQVRVIRPHDRIAARPEDEIATIREISVSEDLLALIREGRALPVGARLEMRTFQATQAADGEWVRGRLLAVEFNERTETGWQPGYLDPDTLLPVPGIDLNACTGCHRAAEQGSIYTLWALRAAAQTGQTQVFVCERRNRVPCEPTP